MRGTLPAHPTKRYATRRLDAIQYLVLHHSAVDVDSTAEETARYHVNVLGWPGCGYSGLAHWDGRGEWTQYLTTVPYHVAGRNEIAAGLCILGDWTHNLPPMPAMETAVDMLLEMRREIGRPVPVVGHRAITIPGYGTACPGDALYQALTAGYGPFARLV